MTYENDNFYIPEEIKAMSIEELEYEKEKLYKEIKEGKNHMSCYGQYYDENGNVCENGASGLCSYCVECQRDCVYY